MNTQTDLTITGADPQAPRGPREVTTAQQMLLDVASHADATALRDALRTTWQVFQENHDTNMAARERMHISNKVMGLILALNDIIAEKA